MGKVRLAQGASVTAMILAAWAGGAHAQATSPATLGAPATAPKDAAAAAPVSPATAPGAPQPGEGAMPAGGLAEIIVTAQRRGERLQDTPITVNAITGATAAAQGVFGTSDLQVVTPGLVFADSGAGPALYLRGVGTQNTAPGDEGSVSTYIDGVYQSSLPGAFSSLANVDRVEVLKGPQGTLFGRNATGGLINIITRDPSFTPTLDASVSAGTYATSGVDLYASGPITSTLAGNISAYYNNQADGWGKNVHTGQDVYRDNEYALRSKLLWKPTETTSLILEGDFSQSRDSNSSGAVDRGAVGLGGNAGLPDFFNIDASLQPLQVNKTYGVSLHAQQDLPFARLISITAYREDNYLSNFDNDRSGLQIVDAFIRYKDKQLTQELQIQSLPSSKVKWIAGAYYLDDKTDLTSFKLVGVGLAAAGGSFDGPAQQSTRSVSGYGQVTVPVGFDTNVTGGLRYTDDERDLTSKSILGFGITLPGKAQTSNYDKLTYRFSVDHHFSRDVMVFASYNRGFKSGIFNLYAPNDPGVRPETLDAYEVGIKSEFLDRRVRVNVSPFYYDYSNIQLVQAFINGTRLLNAAAASSKGVDADFTALPFPGLTVTASLEYLDAHYDSFPGAPAAIPAPATCTPTPTQLPGARTGGNLNCTIDASGNQLIRAPEFTGSLSVDYTWTNAMGKFTVGANGFHSSSFPYEASNRLKQPSYNLVNAQLAWTSSSGRYGVRVYARNLFDERYFTNRISAGADTYAAAAPLTGGVQLSLHL